MAFRVAINGFGRIGRTALRQALTATAPFEIVAINDLTDTNTLAHLLRYDSTDGRFALEVSATDNSITVGKSTIAITAEKDPTKLPWSKLGIDLVLECTGIFTKREQASMHLTAGAKQVIISAPAKEPDITIAYGVNSSRYNKDEHKIISCASCTTNCLAPVAATIMKRFGIKRGSMTTVHSYTNDQRILDLPHPDLRRARAAAVSMIPTTTGAAKAIGEVIPELKGKMDGFALRVPTPTVSVVDLVVETEKPVTAEEANKAFMAAASGELKGVMAVSNEPLVSIDYKGDRHSATVDALSTMVIGGSMLKVIAWYDNEAGFTARMLDTASMIARAAK
jgi:glyceraldehyde 3-phosphate dehydrogenase